MPEAFTNSGVQLTTTGITDVYQVPTSSGARTVVLSSLAANVTGTVAITYNLDVTNSSNTLVASIAKIPNKVVLTSGQKLRATAGAASGIHVVTSVLEIT
jgi:hypothetical protein